MKNIINPKILFGISVIIWLISIASIYFSHKIFELEVVSHFQLQYFIAVIIITIINIFYFKVWGKHFTNILNYIYLAFIFVFFLFPFNFFSFGSSKQDIFVMNTNYYVKNNHIITEHILENEYKVVALLEPNAQIIEKLKLKYGEPKVYLNKWVSSCAVFSQEANSYGQVIDLVYPVCFVQFQEYNLYAIHPLPPVSKENFQLQKDFFQDLSILLDNDNKNSRKFVLAWDFNSSYYSTTFRKHFKQYFSTNHYSRYWLPILTIPIDHGLANFPIKTYLGKKFTSDHKYLEIEFDFDK